jgi:hypothetical protein
MAGMPTTTDPEAEPTFATTSFEACAGFAPADDGSPVCSACGWLAGEHDHGIADVRKLPKPPRAAPRPRRLAS